MSITQTETAIKESLARAMGLGEVVQVAYTEGRKYVRGRMVEGVVQGFVKRPREVEKVQIRRSADPYDTFIRCEVPLGEITAVGRALVAGGRL